MMILIKNYQANVINLKTNDLINKWFFAFNKTKWGLLFLC